MDGLLAKLEISAAVLLTACDAQARRQAEAQIIQLREQPRPYDLCCFILNKTSNEYLIYEAGRCLSRAVVKEWNELFAPSFDQGEACKAKQLLSFVLSWAELRGSQISAAPRQRVLGAAGALAKRAAAAFAEQVAAAWRSTSTDTPVSMTPSQRRWTRHRVLTNPPDDPGPPCDLMLRLVEHIENLVRPLLECGVEDPLPKQDSACQKCLLGLCVMSALLDEVSNAEDSVHFEMVLEAHIFLRARFQDFELVRLFHLLLCVIDWVIRRWSNAQLTSSQLEQNELIFRLVSCLDCIGSWDFLPRELVGFYTSRLRRANREMCFRPSLKWSPIFGPEAMSNTLLLLIKLHTLVRQSDMLGTRTLSFLTRLTAMTGPLTEPVTPLSVPSDDPGSSGASSMDGHGPVSSTACRLHILTCMDYLTYWLDDGADEVSNNSAVLRAFPPDHQRIVNEECQKRLVDPACVPRLALHQLMPYELPIFSELMQDIVIRSPRAWEPVATCLSLPSSSAAEWDSACDTQSVYQHAMLSLVVIDRFFVRMCTLIIQCLKFLATASLSADGDGQPAHEAIERLFNNWIDLFESIPSSGSDLAAGDSADLVLEPGSHEFTYPGTDNLPLPLTTGNLDELDNRTHEIKKLLHILTVNVSRHRIRLFQFYLLSKLGPNVGLRPAGQPEEHIDLDLDEDDLIAYEDSLFACGSCGVAAPDYSIKLLLQLVDERIAQLIRTHGEPVSQTTLDLYEDLHWILLVTGHFLVPGPSSLSKVVRSVFDWYTEFSIPHQLVVVNNEASVDCVMSCRLLHLAASGQFSAFSEAWPPPKVQLDNIPLFLRLIASLYRLLWLQAGSGLGSAQLIQDNLWLLARFAVAYLCHLSFDRELSSPPLRDSSILAILNENLSVLKKASGGTTYGGDVFSQDGDKENETVLFTETRTVCIRGLLTCAGLTLNKWLYEPQVLSKAAGLIQVVGRYSLLASKILRYPAWYELCSVLFNVEESTRIWPNITTDSLMALTESCLCGSYAVDEDTLCIPPSRRPSDGNTEPLFFQLLHGLREHQHRVLAQFTQSRSTVNSLAADDLVRCLASLRGLARAIGWLSAHGKTQSDLISLAWTSALYPALESGAQVLMLQCHNSSEIVQAVFSLFSEVADSCLIYLANVPLGPQLVHTSTAVDTHKVLGSTASASFLSVTMRLCQQYVKQNLSFGSDDNPNASFRRRIHWGDDNDQDKSNYEPTAEDDRISELRLLLTLLNRIFTHAFELRMSGSYTSPLPPPPPHISSNGPLSSAETPICPTPVNTADVTMVCLGTLLPLITEPILMIPELCQSFYSLASYACELRIEAFSHLSDDQLTHLGHLLRLGIFGSAANTFPPSSPTSFSVARHCGGMDNSVTHQCFEILIALVDHCLDVRAKQGATEEELASVCRLSTLIGLNTQLLTDIFGLITLANCSMHLDDVFSSAILCLIHTDPLAFSQLVNQWLDSCHDLAIRERLQTAFVRLSTPEDSSQDEAMNGDRYLAAFNDRKPSRVARVEFQHRFRIFVAEVRAFVCHT